MRLNPSPPALAPAPPTDPAQFSEALQRGIISPADLALRQQVAAAVAAGGQPAPLVCGAHKAAAADCGPAGLPCDVPLSPSAELDSEAGSPGLAALLLECVCLEGGSPTSVLPGGAAGGAKGGH